ncbi:MAG TPA: serine/threonine protein phosphatase [Ruminococcaceae bacterium]|nr:serine/threonine protein phosphatase [Oscillospiraceae bacterium]
MSSKSTFNRMTKIFNSAPEIAFDNSSKLVLLSDCHRGDGSWIDDFMHNQNLYYAAVRYYFNNGFTYFDLGDSDELWKNKKFCEISSVYPDIFRLLHDFYKQGRYHLVYGNHDMVKRYSHFVNNHLESYYNSYNDSFEPLLEEIVPHEGLILKHAETGTKFLLIHGHQGDFISDIFWKLGRFLSRYLWKRLELFGHKDITSAAKNYAIKKKVERKIQEWIKVNQYAVIAGHTHRPACPPSKELPYFNVGSCVHPTCITGIEIVNAEITLIKWMVKTDGDRALYIDREPIAKPRKIIREELNHFGRKLKQENMPGDGDQDCIEQTDQIR